MELVITDVVITSRRHSLYGQRLQVAPEASSRGPDWLTVFLPDGRRRHVHRAATDLISDTDGGTSREPCEARISARTLLPLADCLRALLKVSKGDAADEQHRVDAADQPSCPAATGGLGDRPGVVDGVANGRAAKDCGGLCRHVGSDARAASAIRPGDPPC
ncbi:hypothetical protein [Azospirillum canadense]|uniref:hypothetical protein n=1 Tax=Azospirillum canadense TaxID=403962 RepID=UPI0022280228|nr:hypothetical protein [Azospirillum canadense]MCW2239217.1 hypothetical protein [Azospirillum canadense]